MSRALYGGTPPPTETSAACNLTHHGPAQSQNNIVHISLGKDHENPILTACRRAPWRNPWFCDREEDTSADDDDDDDDDKMWEKLRKVKSRKATFI